MDGEEFQKIYFSDYELDAHRRQLLKSDKPVALNAKAFDLLLFLTRNAGRAVSKDEILNSIWKDQFVEESNLAVQISAIRKALGDKTAEPRFLATIPGKGYQFVAEVSSIKDDTVEDIRDDTANVEPAAPNLRRRSVIIAAAGVVLLFFASFVVIRFFSVSPTIKSIAVLPFVNQTGQPEPEYLSDGLAESVIFLLSRLPNLRVMSRDSSFRFREASIDAKSVGREIGVDAILTGRIFQFADTVSIRTELVSTEDNSIIWGEQFTRKLSDVEKLQVDIAQSITRELKIKLTAPDEQFLKRNQTDDHEAYQLYLLGRYHLNRLTDDGFLKGRDNFRRAIEKDPDYALAYAGLADSYNMLCGWGAMAPNEGYPLAKGAALRALELDETLAEAHTSLGIVKLFYDADWVGAEKDLTHAIEINPNYSIAYQSQSLVFTLQGRFDEAKLSLERSRELDPRSMLNLVMTGTVFYFQRRPSQAIGLYRQAVEMDPNSGLAHWSLGNAYLLSNRDNEAIAEYQKAIPLSGDSPDEPASLAFAYAVGGNQDEARITLDGLKRRTSGSYVPPSLIASIYGALGEKDKAFDLLEQGFRERDSVLVYLKVDPMFDPLRSDPRFPVLQKRIGLFP